MGRKSSVRDCGSVSQARVYSVGSKGSGDSDEQLHNIAFSKWLGKSLDTTSLSDKEHEALTGDARGDEDFIKGKIGKVKLCPAILRAMLPEYFRGKALPMTSGGTAGESNLFQGTLQKNLLQYASEPPSVFPLTTVIPAQGGSALFPQLVQSAPGAENTPTEFGETGNAAVAWILEGSELRNSEAQFSQLNIPMFQIGAYTEVSNRLLRRSGPALDAVLPGIFRQSLLAKLDRAIVSGDGSTQPSGILGVATGVNRAVGAQVSRADLVNLIFSVPPQLRGSCAFVIADGALKYVMGLVDGSQRPLFKSADDLLGFPVIPTQRKNLGDEGDVIFGAFSQYIVGIEDDVTVAFGTQGKIEKQITQIAIFANVGGKPAQARAFAKLV